jgi:flagellar FliJ protein
MPTLPLLLEREEGERDRWLQRLHQAEDALRRAQAQAELLRTYRDEYHQRWGAQFARGASVPLVQCYQGFVARLDQAIAEQQRQVQVEADRAAQTRAALAAQQVRVASVRKLIERRASDAQQRAVRREQKHVDELAARAHQLMLAAATASAS